MNVGIEMTRFHWKGRFSQKLYAAGAPTEVKSGEDEMLLCNSQNLICILMSQISFDIFGIAIGRVASGGRTQPPLCFLSSPTIRVEERNAKLII